MFLAPYVNIAVRRFVTVLEVHYPLEGEEPGRDLSAGPPREALPAHEHLRVLVQVNG
jgi:hypothetical protein